MSDELLIAARDNDAARVGLLLAAGADPDFHGAQGFTPLHLAAQNGSLGAAVALLAAGARVDAVNDFGNTPLFTAVFNSKGNGELIGLLRESGADPLCANDSGQTPLGLARLIANYDVAQFFADLG